MECENVSPLKSASWSRFMGSKENKGKRVINVGIVLL